MKCVVKECKNEANNADRWFSNPLPTKIVPCCYRVCDEHNDMKLNFDYFYNENGLRK